MIQAKNNLKITEENMIQLAIVTIGESWKNRKGINNKKQMVLKIT